MTDLDELIQLAILHKRIQRQIATMTGRPVVGGYTYVDRRRTMLSAVPGWENLPVHDEESAIEAADSPVEQYAADAVEQYEPPKGQPEKAYDFSGSRMIFGEYLLRHAAAKEATDWTKQFKTLLPDVVNDATLLRIDGREVARYRRDGQLNKTQLAKEQPHIIAKYTKLKTKEVFDEAAFKAEEPAMYAAYRARRFCLVSTAAGPLMLPS